MTVTQRKIELLKRIAHRFNEAHVVWALGASMLLYFKGIAPEFHDIDLMISSGDAERVRAILCGMGELQPFAPNPKYHSETFMEFVIDSIDVDVMAGFSILSGGKLHDCSLREDQIAETMALGPELIPLQSPMLWCEYYRLMGRTEKVRMIEDAMKRD